MPAWLLKSFGNEQLTLLFWVVTLLPMPLWGMMVGFPRHRATHLLASALRYPMLLFPGLIYLYSLSLRIGMPVALSGWQYSEVEKFLTHPIIFITIWAQLQLLHLILGIVIYRDAEGRGLRVPVSLLSTLAGGPVGLGVYALRLLVHRLAGRKVKGGLISSRRKGR